MSRGLADRRASTLFCASRVARSTATVLLYRLEEADAPAAAGGDATAAAKAPRLHLQQTLAVRPAGGVPVSDLCFDPSGNMLVLSPPPTPLVTYSLVRGGGGGDAEWRYEANAPSKAEGAINSLWAKGNSTTPPRLRRLICSVVHSFRARSPSRCVPGCPSACPPPCRPTLGRAFLGAPSCNPRVRWDAVTPSADKTSAYADFAKKRCVASARISGTVDAA